MFVGQDAVDAAATRAATTDKGVTPEPATDKATDKGVSPTAPASKATPAAPAAPVSEASEAKVMSEAEAAPEGEAYSFGPPGRLGPGTATGVGDGNGRSQPHRDSRHPPTANRKVGVCSRRGRCSGRAGVKRGSTGT